ncbi:M14 family zinc carboxypeptidase [Peribacillus sp. SCS-26]|uniref:M14 family zinc carboxypeptidase n=1 Tax=Paraperibacillus marinus TaxID=3115295 RepID=UPI003905DB3D
MKKFKLILIGLALLLSALSVSGKAEAAAPIVNPYKTYTFSNMITDIYKLKNAYPGLVQVKVIGKSEFGRNIYAVGLGKGKAQAFINGSHHAREWLTTNLNMYMIDKYASAYVNGSSIKGYNARSVLNASTLWFVPMVNPDGVTLQQKGLTAFPASYHSTLIKMNGGSKNFKRWKSNAKGVDLNRQYDAKWAGTDSPSAPYYRDYKGTAPHTAKEVKAVLSLVNSKDFDMALSYHTSGQILFWNYEQSGTRKTRDYNLAKKLNSLTGYRLYTPTDFSNAAGFSDWFSRKKLRTAFTVEISPYYTETNPPVSEFSGVWTENQAGGLFAGYESAKLYTARMDAKAADLKTKLTSLRDSAGKLKSYYYTNVTTTGALKKDPAFMDLYTRTKSTIASLQKIYSSLPSKNQAELKPLFDESKRHVYYSAKFIKGIYAGEQAKLLSTQQDTKLTGGVIDAALHRQTAVAVSNAKKAQSEMYGTLVRQLYGTKYTNPAYKIYAGSKFALDRSNLLTEAGKLEAAGSHKAADTLIAQYDELNKQSYRFKLYPAIETRLAAKRAQF